jgi:endo-alpha-1,4-polygalactosaminidase (GH114 family)
MDMVCAAHRHKNQASLALVPYKACDEVVMENLTAFQQNEQNRQREQQQQQQQRASLVFDYHHRHQQQQQQQQRDNGIFLHTSVHCSEPASSQHPALKRRRLAVCDLRCSDSMDSD